MKSIDPEPKEDINGDIDYIVPACNGVCYKMTKDNAFIEKCSKLYVDIHFGLFCAKYYE